jgi:hypothetical protein
MMNRTWNFAKNKPHDASGISNPSDWKWQKDERIGVYYPTEKVSKKITNKINTKCQI